MCRIRQILILTKRVWSSLLWYKTRHSKWEWVTMSRKTYVCEFEIFDIENNDVDIFENIWIIRVCIKKRIRCRNILRILNDRKSAKCSICFSRESMRCIIVSTRKRVRERYDSCDISNRLYLSQKTAWSLRSLIIREWYFFIQNSRRISELFWFWSRSSFASKLW